jgi:hypothetical protein
MTRSVIALSILVLLGAGCASSHSLAAPPSPVDVTGVWSGVWSDGVNSYPAVLELQQTESAVTGYHRHSNARRSGMLKGVVAGNVLSYRGVTGDFGADLTVSGDQMQGIGKSGARGLFRREK